MHFKSVFQQEWPNYFFPTIFKDIRAHYQSVELQSKPPSALPKTTGRLNLWKDRLYYWKDRFKNILLDRWNNLFLKLPLINRHL